VHPTALYQTPANRFPFRALAAYAGRAPLGGGREVALACLMVARLGAALLPPAPVPAAARATRARAARGWLASLALPAALRATLARAADASAHDAGEMAAALSAVASAAKKHLDPSSVTELERLASRLEPPR
jgi:hypothetical protein